MDISAYAPPNKDEIKVVDQKQGQTLLGIEQIDQFLTLFIEQLKNQDPLSPMDNTDFLAQTAQITTVEQLMALNANSEASAASMALVGKNFAASLLGKDVIAKVTEADGSTQEYIGRVLDVFYGEDGETKLGLDSGDVINIDDVVNVTDVSNVTA